MNVELITTICGRFSSIIEQLLMSPSSSNVCYGSFHQPSGLCLVRLERSEFRLYVCVYLFHDCGHMPFSIGMKFRINVIR